MSAAGKIMQTVAGASEAACLMVTFVAGIDHLGGCITLLTAAVVLMQRSPTRTASLRQSNLPLLGSIVVNERARRQVMCMWG